MIRSPEEKADVFVERLLADGAEIACDASENCFKEQEKLPPFYDEHLFQRGQKFFHEHEFGLFAGKMFGLLSVLAIPSIVKLLIHTGKSRSNYSAYKRYVATLLHVIIWYESDFKPGSKLWKSIAEVKGLHDAASNSSCKAGSGRISQKDMALTQFGFMGFQLVNGEFFGAGDASDQDWYAFVHVWRVIGHLFGVEDRFNICSGSVEETRAICKALLKRVIAPQINKKNPETLEMSRYLISGLWSYQPTLNFNVIMYLLNVFVNDDKSNKNEDREYKSLSLWEKCLLHFVLFIFYSLRWAPFRWYHNYTRRRDNWLIQNVPFLAYYRFGFRQSYVKILKKSD